MLEGTVPTGSIGVCVSKVPNASDRISELSDFSHGYSKWRADGVSVRYASPALGLVYRWRIRVKEKRGHGAWYTAWVLLLSSSIGGI